MTSSLTKRAADIALAELQLVRDAAQPSATASPLQWASYRVWANEMQQVEACLRARVDRVRMQKRQSAARCRQRKRDSEANARQTSLFERGTLH
jgi:hypothetical protein